MKIAVATTQDSATTLIPALGLLIHDITCVQPTISDVLTSGCDVVLIDAVTSAVQAAQLCKSLHELDHNVVLLAVVDEAVLIAVNGEWGVHDFFLVQASPAEIDARLRCVAGVLDPAGTQPQPEVISVGALTIDELAYTAKIRGKPLDLTYKEFELLKYLFAHTGQVFSRSQLLQEVWGYDFFGGTRTVDVHVRRLRAKLGPEYESMITTVRNVGYKANK